MRNLRRLLNIPLLFPLLLLLPGNPARGQGVPVAPDCQVFITFTVAGSTAVFDNRTAACVSWTIQYTSTGLSGLTLTFQSAQGAVTPGAFGTYGGTTIAGVNPMTSTTGEISTFSNGTVNIPWVQVTLSGLSGAGNVRGVLYGYKSGSGGGGGGGGSGTCPSAVPCIVVGPDAPGAASTHNPVQVAGNDGTDVRAIATDAAGNTRVTGAVAVGGTGLAPVVTGGVNSTNNVMADFFCQQSAAVTIGGSGITQIVPLSAGKVVHICHLDFAAGAISNVTIVTGTGSNCGTGTASLSGVYQSVIAVAIDFGEKGALIAPASNAVCLNFASAVTAGGIVTYAIF